jgi:TonB-dependent Receptor Plug Domain
MLDRRFLYIGLVLVFWQSRAANANDSAVDGEDERVGGIQAVIVTARRIEENSQHVPIAVTVVSGRELQDHGLFTTETMGQLAPGLTVTQAFGSRDLAYFNIRGQLFGVVNYFDEVPITNPQPGSIKPQAGLYSPLTIDSSGTAGHAFRPQCHRRGHFVYSEHSDEQFHGRCVG